MTIGVDKLYQEDQQEDCLTLTFDIPKTKAEKKGRRKSNFNNDKAQTLNLPPLNKKKMGFGRSNASQEGDLDAYM